MTVKDRRVQDAAVLAELFGEAIGRDNVNSRELSVDGWSPSLIVTPGSVDELINCLQLAAGADAALLPAGLMGWLEFGNPLRRLDVILSTKRLNRIIDFSPADLTITAQAGVTIGDLNSAAVKQGQWLPMDPPGAPLASVGAIVSCASSGPLRLGFGTPRDYVIGLKLAHADGTESKCGGRVVKNVAGYDMNKLYTGSFGTLAVLTEIVFKLRPLPERPATVAIRSPNFTSLLVTASAVLNSDLQPVSLFLAHCKGLSVLSVDSHDWVLLVRFIESESAVAYQTKRLISLLSPDSSHILLGESDAAAEWKSVADVDQNGRATVRLGLPLSQTQTALSEIIKLLPASATTADLGVGIIKFAFDADEQEMIEQIRLLRTRLGGLGGTLVVEAAPLGVRRQVDAWDLAGPAAGLMRTIKNSFDPMSLLSPGRFIPEM